MVPSRSQCCSESLQPAGGSVSPPCVSAAKDKGEKKLFGFSFSPLMREDGTTLSDHSHELYVYKVRGHRGHQGSPQTSSIDLNVLLFLLPPQCDDSTSFSNPALYLGLPCSKDDVTSSSTVPSSSVFQRSTKETFWISTQLASTKLTQNGRTRRSGEGGVWRR